MTLAATDVGSGPPRATFVHGFTQVGACLAPLASATGVPCQLLDAPFHGGSVGVDVDLWGAGCEVATTARSGVLVGYSMGARIVLHALLADPACATAAVLISGTAGIEDEPARAARRASDAELAARIEAIGTEAFIDEWLALPMFAGVPADDGDRALRLGNRADALARSLIRLGQGAQDPLWDRLHEISVPVTTVAGAADPRYAAEALRIAGAVQRGRAVVVAGAGHAVHAERTHDVATVIRGALSAT